MGGSLAAELLKLRKRPATWVLGALLVLGLLALYLLLYSIVAAQSGSANPDPGTEGLRRLILPGNALSFVVTLLAQLGGPVGLILGALAAGSEYGWTTLKTILTQRPARLTVLGSKLLGLAIVLVIFVALAFLTGFVSSFGVAQLENASIDWPSLGDLIRGLGAAWLILATWAALGFALAVLFRGTALAIGLGLVYAIILESLISGFGALVKLLRTISEGLLGVNASALASSFGAPSPNGGPPPATIEPLQATLVLLAYLVGSIVIAGLVFRRRDVT